MAEIPPTPSTEPEEVSAQSQSRPSLLLWSILVLVAFVLGLGAGYVIWAQPQQARTAAAEQQIAAMQKTAESSKTVVAGESQNNADPSNQEVKRYAVPDDGDPSLGDAKAPITIIEFSDYQCPFCKKWHDEVFSQIEKEYGDKVRLVYRDFPLYGLHPEAEAAAEAANCAGEQNKYWEYNSLLFSGEKELGAATYTAYGQSLGLDLTQFQKCMDDHKYQSEVKADYDYASQLGVRSTPTFFINGLAVVGAQPFEVFKQVIDLELAGKIPK